MKTENRRQKSEALGLKIFVYCLLFSTCSLLSCGSIPNLENPECIEARNTVKEFYSFHFGNDMKPSEDYLRLREKYLTNDWKFFVSKNLQDKRDLFTLTEDYPKAFRVGGCKTAESNKAVFQVVFFWKDDTRSEQSETKVETVKENGKWLINRTF
jgi:hypothetical protein